MGNESFHSCTHGADAALDDGINGEGEVGVLALAYQPKTSTNSQRDIREARSTTFSSILSWILSFPLYLIMDVHYLVLNRHAFLVLRPEEGV